MRPCSAVPLLSTSIAESVVVITAWGFLAMVSIARADPLPALTGGWALLAVSKVLVPSLSVFPFPLAFGVPIISQGPAFGVIPSVLLTFTAGPCYASDSFNSKFIELNISAVRAEGEGY